MAPPRLPRPLVAALSIALAACALPRAAAAQARGATVSVSARRTVAPGRAETAAMAAVTIPLGDPPSPPPLRDPPPPPPSTEALTPLEREALTRCLRGAFAESGLLAAEERLVRLRGRLRAAAALPTVLLRAGRNASAYATSTTDDLGVVTGDASASDRTFYEARLTFRLDRLAASDEEATLERLRLEVLDRRARLTREVIALYLTRRAALARLRADPRDEEALRGALEGTATLLALTGLPEEALSGPQPPSPPASRSRGGP